MQELLAVYLSVTIFGVNNNEKGNLMFTAYIHSAPTLKWLHAGTKALATKNVAIKNSMMIRE